MKIHNIRIYRPYGNDDKREDSMRKQILVLFICLLGITFFCGCIIIPFGTGGFGESKVKPARLSSIERGILREMNLARTNPSQYALKLKRFLAYYNGNIVNIPGKIGIRTHEGTEAVEEAIEFLMDQDPVAPLVDSYGMSLGAMAHVKDTGPKGIIGHRGSDSSMPQDRVNRYGQWLITVGENVGYGFKNPEYIVIQVIVDDGVRNRGHRRNLFKSNFKYVGIGFGHHQRYRYMNVVDFAGGYRGKGVK